MTPTVTHPHIPVSYDDLVHRYSFNSVTYRSATQIVEHYRNPFDAEKMSLYMADRYGRTPEYWRLKWRDENTASLYRGNMIHSEQEKKEYQKKFLDYTGDDIQMVPSYRVSQVYANLIDGHYPEMLLWRHDDKVAGRSDKVTIWSHYKGRFADVGDYKTNKRLRSESWQEPDGTYRMMRGPISHLMDCEMVHYALQLSLYQYMLEYHGFQPGIRYIIHFPHPIEGLGTPRPKLHKLPYYRDEVIDMIRHLNTPAA